MSMPRETLYGETGGYYKEKKRQLSKSRWGHIGLLTRIYNEIRDLILHKKGTWATFHPSTIVLAMHSAIS